MNFEQRPPDFTPGADGRSPASAPVYSEEAFLELAVKNSLRMLEYAEEAGVALKIGELAIANGIVQPNIADRALNGAKRVMHSVLPFVQSREQKFDKVMEVQKLHDARAADERKVATSLDTWLGMLGVNGCARVTVVDTDHGDPYMSPLTLAIDRGDDMPVAFRLGHNFATEAQLFDELPVATRQRLTERKEFWSSFGLETGADVEQFIHDHFEKIELDLAGGKLTEEMRWLAETDPKIFQQLHDVQADTGRKLYMWRLTKSPKSVVEDVLRIAINTQEKFVSTWLMGFVKREKVPVILPSDYQAIEIAHSAIREKLVARRPTTKRGKFEKRVLLAQLEASVASDTDLKSSLVNIERLRSLVLGLEIEGACNVEQRILIDQANDLMDQDLSGERVADRLMIDTVLHTSEGIQQSLKALCILVPSAEALTWLPLPFIADVAKAVGCLDDLIAETGEMVSLHDQGFKWNELAKRSAIILPVAIGAVALGTQIDRIGQGNHQALAAFLFSLTTFATTVTTLGLTMHSFSAGYRRLARQGKLQFEPASFEAQREALMTAVSEEVDSDGARRKTEPLVSAFAQAPGMSQRDLQRRLAAIEAAIRTELTEDMPLVSLPTKRETLAAAYTEVFGVHPTRLGKLIAIAAMPITAVLAKDVLLLSPLIYVPFGMGETFGGLANAKIADMLEHRRWRSKVRRYTKRARDSHA